MSRRPDLASLAKEYLDTRLARQELSIGTVRNHRTILRSFTQAVDTAPTRADIERWLASRQSLTAATRRHDVSAVRSFCTWLVGEGYLTVDPTAKLAMRPFPVSRPVLPETELGTLVRTYTAERVALHEFSPGSLRNVASTLGNFTRYMADRPMAKMTREDVEGWMASRHKLTAATRRHDLSTVRSFCQWLTRRGYVPADPTNELARVKVPRYIPRAMPAAKVTKLIAAAPDARGALMVLLMVQEGLRCCEVSSLQVGDIDFEARTMRVTGKGGHQRFLPVSDETWAALNTYLAEWPARSGPLVRSYRQQWHALAPDTISGMVSEWMSAAGVKRWPRDGVSAHALRHTMATDALRSGAHLRDVQAALGHAHLSSTEMYIPLVVNDLRDAMGGRRYR